MSSHQLTVGLAQIAPVWLDREATLTKVLATAEDAAQRNCDLVVFGEALLPGYPFWLELTDGARFDSAIQKDLHAHYLANAVVIEDGHLDPLRELARVNQLAIYVGTIERPSDRGGHSVYCSLVYIDQNGTIGSVHRKLMPTYEERLTWSTGDGHGLRTHPLGSFTVGGLNCWENWMPLARAALYGQGEDLHVAVWPGNLRNTVDTTPFLAKEGRSFVVAVSGLMRREDIPSSVPHRELILARAADVLADGGSCLAGPDGRLVVDPIVREERLEVAVIDHRGVLRERQNFDAVGHYSRPDVLELSVDRKRQSSVRISD